MREFTQDLLHLTRSWGASTAIGEYFVESDELWLALLLIQGIRHAPKEEHHARLHARLQLSSLRKPAKIAGTIV